MLIVTYPLHLPTNAIKWNCLKKDYYNLEVLSMMNMSNLERLLLGLENCGVKKYGRNTLVAEKTGYAPGMVAKVLSGHAALTDRFIQSVCGAFNIRKEWIYKGEEPIKNAGFLQVNPKDVINKLNEWFEQEKDLEEEVEHIESGGSDKYRDLIFQFKKIPLDEMGHAISVLTRIQFRMEDEAERRSKE